MNYYHGYYNGNQANRQYIRPKMFSGAIKAIVIANVAVFLFMAFFRLDRFFAYYLGLVPKWVWSRGFVWQLFTYMFVHGGFMHIFWNMFILWLFGVQIERTWGAKEFWKYYLITGVGSGILTLLFSLNSTIPVVGASGAIYAVLVAFGVMFPNRYIYIYFLLPIKAKYFVIIMGAITFFSSLSPSGSNVSHLTHLGGLVIGYIYLKRNKIFGSFNFKLPTIRFKNPFKNTIRRVDKDKSSAKNDDSYQTDETLREQMNVILDKMNESGYDSLTEEERRVLYLASRYFADKEQPH